MECFKIEYGAKHSPSESPLGATLENRGVLHSVGPDPFRQIFCIEGTFQKSTGLASTMFFYNLSHGVHDFFRGGTGDTELPDPYGRFFVVIFWKRVLEASDHQSDRILGCFFIDFRRLL